MYLAPFDTCDCINIEWTKCAQPIVAKEDLILTGAEVIPLLLEFDLAQLERSGVHPTGPS